MEVVKPKLVSCQTINKNTTKAVKHSFPRTRPVPIDRNKKEDSSSKTNPIDSMNKKKANIEERKLTKPRPKKP